MFRNLRSVHDSAPEPSKLRLSAPAMPRVCSGAELFGHRSRPCSGPYSCNETSPPVSSEGGSPDGSGDASPLTPTDSVAILMVGHSSAALFCLSK